MLQRANILIVEDEAVLALDLNEQLTAYGYCVVGTARTGRHALALFQTHRVDLILCDIGLPGDWDGIQTILELTHGQPVPVIYLTGHTDGTLLLRAQATHPVACLLKPWDGSALRRMIKTALTPTSLRRLAIPISSTDPASPFGSQRQPSRVINEKTVDRDTFFIPQSGQFVQIRFQDVLYLQADDTQTTLITANQLYTMAGPLPSILRQLANHRLVRTHRAFAVNLDRVQSFSEWDVRVGNCVLPLGRVYRDAFLAYFPNG